MSTSPVAIVGAGPVGLILALYLARERRVPVVLIEQQPFAGGLYASVQTPWGLVDQGVHIPQESGVPVLDRLLLQALPADQWQVLQGPKKDIAGNHFAGHLNEGAVYPDLRRLPRPDYLRCLGEMLANAGPELPDYRDAPHLHAYFSARFGAHCTETVFEPIAHKLWRQPLHRMSPWAAKLVHLVRVVTHDHPHASVLKASPALDAVIGFPDQLAVPASTFSHRTRALYPRQWGLKGVVDGLERALQQAGVRLLTQTDVQGLDVTADRVTAVHLKHLGDNRLDRLDVSALLWTSPLPPLGKMLACEAVALPDPMLAQRVVHLFLDQPPATGALYWFWAYGADDCLVRVSSPHAYCPDAARDGRYPVCAEIQVPDPGLSDADAAALAERDLRRLGVIGATTQVVGQSVLKGLRAGFVPTLANCDAMDRQRRGVDAARPANLLIATQHLSDGIFYMPDILRAGLAQLENLPLGMPT